MVAKKRSLGRNLEALLGKSEEAPKSVEKKRSKATGIKTVDVKQLQPGKYQPRREMNPEALQTLSDSIKTQGVLQPIIIRPVGRTGKKFEIIAGERRWRAAQLAGLTDVPVIERSLSNEEAMAIGLIENIQREDLNPLEEAAGLDRLIKEFDLTHNEIAELLGRSRSAISNLLRLLALAAGVKRLLECGDLDMGHARSLLVLNKTQQLEAAHIIIEKNLSVREAETLVKHMLEGGDEEEAIVAPTHSASSDPDVIRLQEKLSAALNTPVQIKHRANGKGKFIIQYKSIQALEQLLKTFEAEQSHFPTEQENPFS